MSLILFAPFAGFATACGLLWLFHSRVLVRLWHEPALTVPIVIVESDDWGPGPAADGEVLERLARLLAGIRDADGAAAVMTLGVVLGKPDGAAILADDCGSYRRSTLDEPRYTGVLQAMRNGCAAGVFALQRHGLEHCWPASLLACARQDAALRAWLADPGARSEALPSALQSRWVDVAALPSSRLSEGEIRAAVTAEAALFRCLFADVPTVAVPNTFVWDDAVERAWAESGVRWVVTCGRRYEGRTAEGGLQPAVRRIVNDETGAGGVRYVVRDAYFEPMRGHRAEQVWQAVAERTALARPTLLETHRENFIASPEIAQASLAELGRALEGVCRRHPAVRFLDTAQLGEAFRTPGSPLLMTDTRQRAGVFLRRLLAEPDLSRTLKLSGLRFLLPLVVRMLGRM